MAFPPVSIIVPTGRKTGLLADLIKAVRDLDYPLFELILSCEKGTDLPGELMQLISTSSRIRIVTTEHANPSSLRNAGVKASRYELLAFTDSDCTPDRAWLKELVAVKQALGTGAVVGSSISSNYSRSRWSRVSANRYSAWLEGIREGDYLNRLDTRNLLIAKDLIERLGAFDEELPSKEDRDNPGIAVRDVFHGVLYGLPGEIPASRDTLHIPQVSELEGTEWVGLARGIESW